MNARFLYCNTMVFVLAFFSRTIINIGGEISPSFLIMLATMPIWFKYISFRDKNVSYVSKLMFGILTVQVIWIPFAQTDLMQQVKGLFVTLSALMYFWFYYFVYSHNKDCVKWGLLGSFLATFFFVDVLAELAGGEFGMWKFQIYPRFTAIVVMLYVWFIDKPFFRKNAPMAFMLIALLGFATGCRSNALYCFLPGVVCFFIARSNKTINIGSVRRKLVMGAIFLYLAYACIYVPNVLDGTITQGNTEQLLRAENPYNPINLLMVGRSDAIVPFMAFLDNPITGWGWYTPDPNFKYHIMNSVFNESEIRLDLFRKDAAIPGHSIWGYYSCSYGIIVFLLFFLITKFVCNKVLQSLVYPDKWLLYRMYVLTYFLWTLLFAPTGFFKTLPSSIALIIIFSITAKDELDRQNHRSL